MSEEEKEAILKASDFLFELDKSGHKYSCYGREIYIRDNVFRVIDKLQKVIELMATEISRRPLMIYLDNERDDRLVILDNPKEIIKYYTKKAEE